MANIENFTPQDFFNWVESLGEACITIRDEGGGIIALCKGKKWEVDTSYELLIQDFDPSEEKSTKDLIEEFYFSQSNRCFIAVKKKLFY